jgi:membrane-bound lytic murein transglycosylase F
LDFHLPYNRRDGLSPAVRFAGYLLQAAVVATAVALLATCSSSPSVLGRVQRDNTLVLATPNSPTTYYLGAYGAAGPAYDLAKRFADELGVRLKILEVPNGHDALTAVASGRADIAAPGIGTSKQRPGLRFTPAYEEVSSLLVYRAGEAVPATMSDLSDSAFKLTVAPGFAPLMHKLSKSYPAINWTTSSNRDSSQLLIDVAQGKLAYTVVNENTFNLNRHFYPRLRVAFALGNPQPLGWAVQKRKDSSLYQAAVAFFARAKANQIVAEVLKRYYGEHVAYNRASTQTFLHNVNRRLDEYSTTFHRAATATGLSWQLLAAVGYQESHWNPRAVSPTGVRGLMMLTAPTAQSLGIHNRTDPHLSIIGAARYLAQLIKRLPASISQPDRSWMALAAYNIGYGHILDARKLTQRQGGNPNSWADVKKRLVMLSQGKYYRHARYGYADGRVATHYVANIRSYYNILAWRSAQNTLPAQVTQPIAQGSVAAAQ